MRKFAIGITGAVTLMLVGSASQNTEAMTLAVRPQPNYSLVERAGCWLPGLPGGCDIGESRVCDRYGKRCRCKPCPGWYPWRQYKAPR
jgi:hypothetical protein